MTTSSKLVPTLAVIGALLAPAVGLDAQTSPLSVQLGPVSATATTGQAQPTTAGTPADTEYAGRPVAECALCAPWPPQESSRPSAAAAVFLTGLGSVGGFLAGAIAGGGVTNEWGGAFIGGLVGSFVGGGAVGSAVTRDPTRACVGSALGVLGGVLAASAFGADDTLAVVGYAGTHAIVTVAFGNGGR